MACRVNLRRWILWGFLSTIWGDVKLTASRWKEWNADAETITRCLMSKKQTITRLLWGGKLWAWKKWEVSLTIGLKWRTLNLWQNKKEKLAIIAGKNLWFPKCENFATERIGGILASEIWAFGFAWSVLLNGKIHLVLKINRFAVWLRRVFVVKNQTASRYRFAVKRPPRGEKTNRFAVSLRGGWQCSLWKNKPLRGIASRWWLAVRGGVVWLGGNDPLGALRCASLVRCGSAPCGALSPARWQCGGDCPHARF